MRIISQDARFDFPYELMAVYISPKNNGGASILCRWQADQKASNILAEYSCEENAFKALEMLHDAYGKQTVEYEDRICTFETMFRFPSNKELEDKKIESGAVPDIQSNGCDI